MSIDRVGLRRRALVASGGVTLDLADWNDLCDDAIAALWQAVVMKNADFRVKTLVPDFTIVDTTQNTLDLSAVAPDFMNLRTLCRNPGTPSEEYLTKVGPRTGSLDCARGYRLEGSTLVIEPYERSAGTYRLKYTPQPPLLTADTGTGSVLDYELAQFSEFVVAHMAAAAMASEESPNQQQVAKLTTATANVVAWASNQRSADPDQVEDVRRVRRGVVWYP
jgi:hypothetical protein